MSTHYFRCTSLVQVGLVFIGLLIFTGCTTPRQPRPPSTYLLSTEKSQVQSITELSELLKSNKYEIKNLNTQTGFLITKPRRFNVNRADKTKVSTEQSLIIRQEGGSLTVRANYDCEYIDRNNKLILQPCYNDDVDVNNRIRRVEGALLKLIRKKIEEEVASPAEKDLTVESSQTPAQK